MLVVETIARIRRDHLVKGVPIKKIARDLGVSKNTVRKVVRSDETSFSYARADAEAWGVGGGTGGSCGGQREEAAPGSPVPAADL